MNIYPQFATLIVGIVGWRSCQVGDTEVGGVLGEHAATYHQISTPSTPASTRAVNELSRSFTVPKEGPYYAKQVTQ